MKKFLSLILVSVILLQIPGITAFAKGTEEYKCDVLAAINTSVDDDLRFSAYIKEENTERKESESEQDELGDGIRRIRPGENGIDVINDITPLSPEEADKLMSENFPELGAKASGYKIGDTKKLSSDNQVAECIYIGENCTVWNQIEGSEFEYKDGYFKMSDEKCTEYGKWLDEMIPKEKELYGDRMIDTDGDGKIAVIFHSFLDADGYVFYSDFSDRINRVGNVFVANSFNTLHCDCIHVINLDSDVDDLSGMYKSTLVHEYQHVIHFSYGFVGKNNRTYFYSTAPVTEGFSTAAEYILADENRDFYPCKEMGSLFDWSYPDENISKYSLVFAFFQYVRTRYAQLTNDTENDFPGKYVYKTILEKMTKKEHNGFRIAADLLYPEKDYPALGTTEERLKQLVVDFWIAAFLQDETGIHGFNGDRITDDFSLSYINYGFEKSDMIYPGMAEFYVLNDREEGTAVITQKDDGIVFVPLNNCYRNCLYDSGDGTGEIRNEKCLINSTICPCDEYEYAPAGSLKGWEINGKEYRAHSDNLIKIHNDITFCAITEPGEVIDCGTYSFDGEEYSFKCYLFTPRTTGIYKITNNSGFRIINPDPCCEYGDNLPDEYSEFTDESICRYYSLESGKTYSLIVYPENGYNEDKEEMEYFETKFSIAFQENHHALTYDFNGLGTQDNYTVNASEKYIADEPFGDEYYILKSGKYIKGWSRNRDSAEPEFKAGEIIELTEDTTLYAVWSDLTRLGEGKNDTEKGTYYLFEPENPGAYCFEGDSGYVFHLGNPIMKESDCYWDGFVEDREKRVKVSGYADLEEAKKCLIVSGCTSVTITDITDAVVTLITYHTGEFSDFEIADGYKHTVISYKPISENIKERFLGWATYEGATEPEYFSGDEIEAFEELDLYAVYENKPYMKNLSQSFLSFARIPVILLQLANMIRFIITHPTYLW